MDSHAHAHVHLNEADWGAWAAQAELEGELLLGFVTDATAWVRELRATEAPGLSRIIDIGSGPGVGTCELARLFPDAHVTAVDSSPEMLDRTRRRAAAHGLEARISTQLAEVPGGLEGLEGVDLIWASMALHHVGDEVSALRVLGRLLDTYGLLAIAEMAEPMRVLPDDLDLALDLGRPGLVDRLGRLESSWFAGMREGLTDSVPSGPLPEMVAAAGFEVIGSRLARERFDPPLSEQARRVVLGHLGRVRDQIANDLDSHDIRALEVLSDPDDPRGVMHRSDVFVESSRQIVIARPIFA